MPADDLLKLIKWLDPSRKPVVVMGTRETIEAFAERKRD